MTLFVDPIKLDKALDKLAVDRLESRGYTVVEPEAFEFRYNARDNGKIHLEVLKPVEHGWIIIYMDDW